jgi:hypothetical protein
MMSYQPPMEKPKASSDRGSTHNLVAARRPIWDSRLH